jgi:hypothetical protein
MVELTHKRLIPKVISHPPVSSPAPGQWTCAQLIVHFVANIVVAPQELCGFYSTETIGPQEKKYRGLSTQFEPCDARRAFPCFDEPAIKAKYKVLVETCSVHERLSF